MQETCTTVEAAEEILQKAIEDAKRHNRSNAKVPLLLTISNHYILSLILSGYDVFVRNIAGQNPETQVIFTKKKYGHYKYIS